MKPREVWVEFGGDPSNDKEIYKRYCGAQKFEPGSYAEEVVHFIEFSAWESRDKDAKMFCELYNKALDQIVELKKRLGEDPGDY